MGAAVAMPRGTAALRRDTRSWFLAMEISTSVRGRDWRSARSLTVFPGKENGGGKHRKLKWICRRFGRARRFGGPTDRAAARVSENIPNADSCRKFEVFTLNKY